MGNSAAVLDAPTTNAPASTEFEEVDRPEQAQPSELAHDHVSGSARHDPADHPGHSESEHGDELAADQPDDANAAIQLGLEACHAFRVLSLASSPVSNSKEPNKSLKSPQDPGKRPHNKDLKKASQNPKNQGKDGVARLPSRPGTTPQKQMTDCFRVGRRPQGQENEERPQKDPLGHLKDSWDKDVVARHPIVLIESHLTWPPPKGIFLSRVFRTSDRARPSASDGHQGSQSAHEFSLDGPVPKWLRLWRATRPIPLEVQDPIVDERHGGPETFSLASDHEGLPALRALRHGSGGAPLPKAPKRKAKAKTKSTLLLRGPYGLIRNLKP
eukprot:s3507_g10.t1